MAKMLPAEPAGLDRHELWRQVQSDRKRVDELIERLAQRFEEIDVEIALHDREYAGVVEGMTAALRLMNDLARRVAAIEASCEKVLGP